MKTDHLPIVVVGAGPYGLSLAAHLRARNVPHRIFGRPMSMWSEQMPRGMFLKSEGFSANLSDPGGRYTLREFCQARGLEYADVGTPVALQTFLAYGQWFQQERVPQVEPRDVVRVEGAGARFRLRLSDGEELTADQVVLAVGIGAFAHVPPALAALPRGHVSHTSAHHDLSGFAGRSVALVGGGQSALETAALLHEAGARPQVLVRKNEVVWNAPSRADRSLWARLSAPQTALGASWKLQAYLGAPWAFRHLRPSTRLQMVRNTLGPAGSWWLRERVLGKVPITCSVALQSGEVADSRVRLTLLCNGESEQIEVDHVMAATGYRVDLEKLSCLDAALREQLRTCAGYPVLSGDFESSVRGLYFIGVTAALTYGPVQRFVAGVGLAARRVSAAASRRAAPVRLPLRQMPPRLA